MQCSSLQQSVRAGIAKLLELRDMSHASYRAVAHYIVA